MLEVITMEIGAKYRSEYVRVLSRMLRDNLSIDYRLNVVTDRPQVYGQKDNPDDPIISASNSLVRWPGWWNKLNLFNFAQFDTPGRLCLWLDLDLIILRDLGPLIEYGSARLREGADLVALKNWAQSGHGGVQSSVMLWNSANDKVRSALPYRHQIDRHCGPTIYSWPPRNDRGHMWGDQEYITEARDLGLLSVGYFAPDFTRSYKYHAREAEPRDPAAICIFHGKPNPDEAGGWAEAKWRSYASR
jgi:hypothetical protein